MRPENWKFQCRSRFSNFPKVVVFEDGRFVGELAISFFDRRAVGRHEDRQRLQGEAKRWHVPLFFGLPETRRASRCPF